MRVEQFVTMAPDQRATYFQEAAARRGMAPAIIEKDFWVCWLLRAVFESEIGGQVVFKGGTSLSKAFRVIERFSEDIDLSLAPAYLGLPEPDLDGLSTNQGSKWMKRAEQACQQAVATRVHPLLERLTAAALPPRDDGWFLCDEDLVTKSPVLRFRYPATELATLPYLRPEVKLEFGSLTDQRPTGQRELRPWLLDHLPSLLDDWNCAVVALELERSFWEKATILHAEHHRDGVRERAARHYADLACLAGHPAAERALQDTTLRDRVVLWKSLFFGSRWASYGTARPPTSRLLPARSQEEALARDYQAMREMFFGEPLDWSDLCQALTRLEQRINEPAAPAPPSRPAAT